MNLDTVIVTGAGSGIGLATVRSLLGRGVTVVGCDVNVDALSAIESPGLTVRRIDLRDPAAADLLAEAVPAGSPIGGLVACAAVFERRPFLELTEALWEQTIAINLTGSFLACRAVLPRMRAQRSGSIVLLSSSLARTGSPTGGHYAATKGGVLGLARSLALEVAPEGIRVNVLSPGLTDTPQPRGHAGGLAAMRDRARTIPLGRMGTVHDMVSAIEFLLGPDSAFVTGQDLRVNGGSQIG